MNAAENARIGNKAAAAAGEITRHVARRSNRQSCKVPVCAALEKYALPAALLYNPVTKCGSVAVHIDKIACCPSTFGGLSGARPRSKTSMMLDGVEENEARRHVGDSGQRGQRSARARP